MIEPYQFAEQASNIKAMMQSPGWQFYCQVIMDKIAMTMETALEDAPEQLPFHKGSIYGMKAAILTAKDCLNMAAEFHSEDSKRDRQSRLIDREGPSTL